ADAPLFLFHLLEFLGIPFEIDIDELNERWAEKDNIDSWCQMVVKHTDDSVDLITEAPRSGIWHMNNDGTVEYARFDYHRRAVETENEAFFLRIMNKGDYRYEGADLGILVLRGRAMDDRFQLQVRTRKWIKAIRSKYKTLPLTEPVPVTEEHMFKIL
ncbi:MAG: biotin carboxylase, partial [Burkholderiales bacterium]